MSSRQPVLGYASKTAPKKPERLAQAKAGVQEFLRLHPNPPSPLCFLALREFSLKIASGGYNLQGPEAREALGHLVYLASAHWTQGWQPYRFQLVRLSDTEREGMTAAAASESYRNQLGRVPEHWTRNDGVRGRFSTHSRGR